MFLCRKPVFLIWIIIDFYLHPSCLSLSKCLDVCVNSLTSHGICRKCPIIIILCLFYFAEVGFHSEIILICKLALFILRVYNLFFFFSALFSFYILPLHSRKKRTDFLFISLIIFFHISSTLFNVNFNAATVFKDSVKFCIISFKSNLIPHSNLLISICSPFMTVSAHVSHRPCLFVLCWIYQMTCPNFLWDHEWTVFRNTFLFVFSLVMCQISYWKGVFS